MSTDVGTKKGGKNDNQGKNLVAVMIDQQSKDVRRGNYTLEELKAELGVAVERGLDLIDEGQIRPIQLGEKITIKEGMEFVSRQQAGGAS
jgi:hypothetical protein